MMSCLPFLGGIIGLLANVPLIIGIYKNKIQQSFATYLLWGILDAISAITIILQHGNYWLPLFYSFSAISVAFLLMAKKQVTWTWFETLVAVLVSICIIVWYFTGEKFALIASIISLTIASFPQILETFKKPFSTPTGIYLIFCLANFLSFVGGKSFSLEEKLYPGSALVLCLIIAVLSVRKIKTSTLS